MRKRQLIAACLFVDLWKSRKKSHVFFMKRRRTGLSAGRERYQMDREAIDANLEYR